MIDSRASPPAGSPGRETGAQRAGPNEIVARVIAASAPVTDASAHLAKRAVRWCEAASMRCQRRGLLDAACSTARRPDDRSLASVGNMGV